MADLLAYKTFTVMHFLDDSDAHTLCGLSVDQTWATTPAPADRALTDHGGVCRKCRDKKFGRTQG